MLDVASLRIRADEHGVVVDVLVAPRSSQCAFAGVHDGRIKVMLDAPPVDGKANDALNVTSATLVPRNASGTRSW